MKNKDILITKVESLVDTYLDEFCAEDEMQKIFFLKQTKKGMQTIKDSVLNGVFIKKLSVAESLNRLEDSLSSNFID